MPSGATTLSRPPAPSQSQPRRKFRLDIQGLRAFAVIVVILDHMFAWPTGGFVGVDIFFVISGFLITGHLMREWEETGHISFLKFYKGRIKRILPAATLVLAVTVGAAFLLLNKARAMSVLWDGVWASLFAGNWRFAAAGTDYFQSDGPVSPLQHFWSLAVEEQFYFVWPWIMLLALLIVGRANSAKMRSRVVAGLLLGALSAASFAWAMVETTASPTMAYFSTFSRAWELGLGALLAIAAPLMLRINNNIRPALAWIGITGMVASVFVINSSMAFPAPTALVPVLSTVLVIAAGTGGEQKYLVPLTNPVSAYIGNISYSLYLWHFPVIILVGPMLPWDGALGYLVQLAIIAFISVAAYHMWEDAIRKGPWLEGRKAWKNYKLPNWYKNGALVFLAMVTSVAVATTFIPADPVPVSAAESIKAATSDKKDAPKVAVKYGKEVSKVQDEIKQSLKLTAWPKTSPSLDEAVGGDSFPEGVPNCGEAEVAVEDCIFGSSTASKTAFLVGDSVAMRWLVALLPTYGEGDWNLHVRARYGCPSFDVRKKFASQELADECSSHNEQVVSEIKEQSPDLVLISNTYAPPASLAGGDVKSRTWGSAALKYMESLGSKSEIVALSAPPAAVDIVECYTPRSTPSECTGVVPKIWNAMSDAEKFAAETAGATYVDTRPLFCSDDMCPPVNGSTPIKHDKTHITMQYSISIKSALIELIGKPGK